FDVVVLDPSKQTRDREEIGLALKRYLDMNRLAMHAVAPGGLFLTCSCTGLVSEGDFLECLRRAAWQAGRTVQVLRIAGAAADHPFLLQVPEGRYLKAIFCRVERRAGRAKQIPSRGVAMIELDPDRADRRVRTVCALILAVVALGAALHFLKP